LRLGIEPLEARTMLDGSTPSLVVGRVLSSYTVGDVQANGNQETLTYAVYNNAPDTETGVELTDTLGAGVTAGSTTGSPTQNGQTLTWNLGDIPAFGRASVSATVTLGNTNPTQLDTGARATATLAGAPLTATAPAAVLRTDTFDPSLLASTPDANTTDYVVQEKAAELGYSAQNIFNFLHTQIGYESYAGSLRGARGTLWSAAGNALDTASLGVALLRASGIPAQYAEGTLTDTQAKGLILSMFSQPSTIVGCTDPSLTLSDPANDPKLLAETRDHFWVEYLDSGSTTFTAADPELASQTGSPARAPVTATSHFSEVADNLRHKVEVQLNAEITSTASSLFGGGLGTPTPVLDHTFNTVDLVGKPLAIGNFVNRSSGGFIFTATTTTYSPYIAIGDEADDPASAVLLRGDEVNGKDYQEVLTNFPFGTQVLTGLFLDLIETGPGLAPQTFERTLVDRVGFAARHGGGDAGSLSVDPNGPPAITPYDITTVDILGAKQNLNDLVPISTYAAKYSQAATNDATSGAIQSGQSLPNGVLAAIANGRLNAVAFRVASDEETQSLAKAALVRAYDDQARITIVAQKVAYDSTGKNATITNAIDLRNDTIRAIAAPGQATAAAVSFQITYGISEGSIETELAADNLPANSALQPVTTTTVFEAAAAQNIPTIVFNQGNLSSLDQTNFPAEAKARITDAVNAGKDVLVPSQTGHDQRRPANRLVRDRPQHRRDRRRYPGRRPPEYRRVHLGGHSGRNRHRRPRPRRLGRLPADQHRPVLLPPQAHRDRPAEARRDPPVPQGRLAQDQQPVQERQRAGAYPDPLRRGRDLRRGLAPRGRGRGEEQRWWWRTEPACRGCPGGRGRPARDARAGDRPGAGPDDRADPVPLVPGLAG
jgi:hypothetical protein